MIKEKISEFKDEIANKLAFGKCDKAIDVIVLKGKKQVEQIHFNCDKSMAYFLNDKSIINKNDIFVTKREEQFEVVGIDENFEYSFFYKDQEHIVKVTRAIIKPHTLGKESFLGSFNNDFKQNPTIQMIFTNCEFENSSNIGNFTNTGTITFNINNTWPLIKHDLENCFKWKEYEEIVKIVEETIESKNKDNRKLQKCIKIAKGIGSVLGAGLSSLITALIVG